MKTNSTKSLKWLAALVIILCAATTIHVTWQGIGSIVNPQSFGVQWYDDVKWLQVAVLVGRMLGGIAFSILMTIFIIKSVRALKNGVLFPRCNVGILYGSAASFFLYRFCYSNMGIASGVERNLLINLDDVIVLLVIIIFAIIYKFAVKVSEENSLTI